MTHDLPSWTPSGEIILSKIDEVTRPNGHGPLRLKDDIRQAILIDLKSSGVDPNILGRLEIKILERGKRPGSVKISGNSGLDIVKVGINLLFGPEVLRCLDLSLKD